MPAEKLRIRHVDPRTLTPAPYNPNLMTETARAKLRRSLEEYGFVEPVVVNTRTGWIVGGHHRVEVAIEMGLSEVPIVERDLDPDRERALNVALNNPEVQGQLDPGLLLAALAGIEDTPLLELTGFDFDQYQALQITQAQATKAGREGYVGALPAEAKTRPGQRWALGERHTLVIGDATDPDSYDGINGRASMCFTDPPYNVGAVGRTDEQLTMLNDRWPDEASYAAWLAGAFARIRERTAGAVYSCYGMQHAPALYAAWDEARLHRATSIAWVKDRFVIGGGDYHGGWEAILYGWPDGEDHYWIGDRDQANVWDYTTPKRGDRGRRGPSNVWRYQRPAASRLHPTMKPVLLVEHALRNSSRPGDLVLDPFAGSGSTMVAAENTGRHSYQIELDPRYADVIITRYDSLETGQPARKTGGPR